MSWLPSTLCPEDPFRSSRAASPVALVLLAAVALLLCGPSPPAGGAPRAVAPLEPLGTADRLDLVATEVPATGSPRELPRLCVGGSRLVRLGGSSGRSVLTAGMDAACDPVLGPDGLRLVFRGRETPGQSWRIWELDLRPGGSGDPRALSPADRSCVRPLILADGGIGFVCAGDLFRTPAPDAVAADPAAAPVRLTASGGAIEAATVLPDGRLLLRTADGSGAPILLTAQPDGTWATRWRDASVAGLERARPLPPDRLLLATGAEQAAGLWIGSLDDPFAPLRPVAREALGNAVVRDPAPVPGDGDDIVLALRPAGDDRFRLARLELGAEEEPELTELAWPTAGAPWPEAHLLQPVPLAPRPPDTEIPSIVKPELNTGYLVLFDAARSDHPVYGGVDQSDVAAVRIFPWGDGAHGATAVDLVPAEDGSLHLEVPADRPLGFALVDADGSPLGPPGGPVWVRPNERRACMGCHVSRRFAPPNVRPRALFDPPQWIGWGSERVSPRSEFEQGSD